jgi:hypothetical protein
MKASLLLVLLFAGSLSAESADTAYSALRVVGQQQGEAVLNRVVEVRGRFGAPEPAQWKVVVDDPAARGGLREFDVQRGRVVAERTPASRDLGRPINLNQLNLDSDGAFTVANQEAQKIPVPFDRVDYVLRSGTRGGAPVWQLELFDRRNGRVGSLDVSADTGSVLGRELERPRGRTAARPVEDDDRAYLEAREGERRPGEVDDEEEGEHRGSGDTLRDVGDFFGRVGNRFEKRGRQLKNFFTGRGFTDERRRDR